MACHFSDKLLPVSQAVVVKGIIDKADMVKPLVTATFFCHDLNRCPRQAAP